MPKFVKISGVDLFAGAGGLSLGAKKAGIDVVLAIENNKAAAASYKANHQSSEVIESDIQSIKPRQYKNLKPLVLFGGPPCQGFSTSNQRTRNTDNPRNWLFSEVFRFAKILKPEWIVLENVTGLQGTAQGLFIDLIEKEFKKMKYTTAVWNLCAADFGVPQTRNRLFIIGRRNCGEIPDPPKPKNATAVTVREAIADLPRLLPGSKIDKLAYGKSKPSKYAKRMRGRNKICSGNLVTANNKLVIKRYEHIPEGGNWCDIPKRLMRNYTNLINDRSRHSGIYKRLKWNSPSVVIANFRKNMLIHPSQNRGLSVREAARIQSFPDDYSFSGSIGQQQQQISNAVPPLLAKAVFKHIIANT